MPATYVTVLMKRRRTRLQSLQWKVAGFWLGVAFALSFLSQFLILDAMPTEPRFRGLHEANNYAAAVMPAVALAWFLSFLPVVDADLRARALERSRLVLAATGVLWIVWTVVRGSSLFR
jgi:hypothetical protein